MISPDGPRSTVHANTWAVNVWCTWASHRNSLNETRHYLIFQFRLISVESHLRHQTIGCYFSLWKFAVRTEDRTCRIRCLILLLVFNDILGVCQTLAILVSSARVLCFLV